MNRASVLGRHWWRALSAPAGLLFAANVLLALATGAAAVTLWQAVRLEPMPRAAPPVAPPLGDATPLLALRAPDDAGELDNDPFRFDRQLPETEDAAVERAAAAASEPELAIGTVRLVGTVVLPGSRGFAVYQLPSQPPRTWRVGERVGGLRLEAVAPGRIVLRAPDGERVELHLLEPGG